MRMGKWKVCLVLGLVALPVLAQANAGSAVIFLFLPILALLVNVPVAAIEVALLNWLGQRKELGFGRLWLANMASAIAGLVYFGSLQGSIMDPFRGGYAWIVAPYFVAFGMSVLIEAAIVLPVYAKERSRRWRWTRFSVVNVVSMLPFIAAGGLWTDSSALGRLSHDPVPEGVPAGWIYFLRGEQIWRVRSDGARPERFAALKEGEFYIRVGRNPDSERAQLVAIGGITSERVIVPDLGDAGRAATQFESQPLDEYGTYRFVPRSPDGPSVRQEYNWYFSVTRGPSTAKLGMRSPSYSLGWGSNLTVVTDRFVLAEFGWNVVWVDQQTMRIHRVGLGASPAFLRDEPVKTSDPEAKEGKPSADRID